MISKKPISWFLTEQGRKFSYVFATGFGISLAVARYVPNTFGLNKYKELLHFYSDGRPLDLPKDLKDRCQKCLDILQVSATHKKIFQPFCCFGFDLFHAGYFNSKFGVAVGIPINFTYKSESDVQENDKIQVNLKQVDWSSEAGKKLLNSLLLSEEVQEFAICREILMTKNNKVIFESSYPFLCVFMVYNLSQYLNRRLNLHLFPLFFRSIMYSIVGLFGLGTYFMLKDMTEVSYEVEVDKKLCALGPDFIKSGVIFYDKILQRNQALRELMGNEGERKYSKLGNENFLIRQPRIALVHRKQYFEEMLKKASAPKNEEDNINEVLD